MISDAYVTVECNGCGEFEEVQDSGVDRWLKRNLWTGNADGNEHLCPDCQEKAKQSKPKRKRRPA